MYYLPVLFGETLTMAVDKCHDSNGSKNWQKIFEKFWYQTHAWHASTARVMRYFSKLTNQSAALTQWNVTWKCGKVLQWGWKAGQVIVCRSVSVFHKFCVFQRLQSRYISATVGVAIWNLFQRERTKFNQVNWFKSWI